MLTNWSLLGPDDDGHVWINIDHPDGTKSGHNLGPEAEVLGKIAALLMARRGARLEEAMYSALRSAVTDKGMGYMDPYIPGDGDTFIEHSIDLRRAAEAFLGQLDFGERPSVCG